MLSLRTNNSRLRSARILRMTWFICLILSSSVSVFGARKERLIDSWKPLNYDVTLTFNNNLSEITKARVIITVEAIKSVSLIVLDFGEIPIDFVTVDPQTPLSLAMRDY